MFICLSLLVNFFASCFCLDCTSNSFNRLASGIATVFSSSFSSTSPFLLFNQAQLSFTKKRCEAFNRKVFRHRLIPTHTPTPTTHKYTHTDTTTHTQTHFFSKPYPSQAVITRERNAGAYRVSSYFLSKTIAELPIIMAFPSVHGPSCSSTPTHSLFGCV